MAFAWIEVIVLKSFFAKTSFVFSAVREKEHLYRSNPVNQTECQRKNRCLEHRWRLRVKNCIELYPSREPLHF